MLASGLFLAGSAWVGVSLLYAPEMIELASWITAIATGLLVLGAGLTWKTAQGTLRHAREDSTRRTRPYVYAVLVPGLWGPGNWDLKIHNAGQSAARELTAELSGWPEKDDLITSGLRQLFSEPQILPPGVSYRIMWRTTTGTDQTATGPVSDPVNGIPGKATITFHYRGEDPNEEPYPDTYVLHPDVVGAITPAASRGPEPAKLESADKQRHRMMQHIVEALGELRR